MKADAKRWRRVEKLAKELQEALNSIEQCDNPLDDFIEWAECIETEASCYADELEAGE